MPEPEPDAVAARILEEAAAIIAGRAPERAASTIRRIAVVGDLDGALALGAARLATGATITRFADALDAERAADQALEEAGVETTSTGLDAGLLADADLVLARLPKANEELRLLAALAAAHGSPHVLVVAGAREKHLHPAQSTVLAERFASVRGSLGRRKARALVASGPEPAAAAQLARSAVLVEPEMPGGPVELRAIGGVFAGGRLDLGTRSLLAALDAARERPELRLRPGATVVDLGCGTGLLAIAAARRWPDAEVIATDRSWCAVESARASAAANGLADRIRVERDVAGGGLPRGRVDLILCNPPFHDERAVIDDLARPIFAGAAAALRPGGAMATVFNSHLPHRRSLERIVGPTIQLARDPRFTVALSVRRG